MLQAVLYGEKGLNLLLASWLRTVQYCTVLYRSGRQRDAREHLDRRGVATQQVRPEEGCQRAEVGRDLRHSCWQSSIRSPPCRLARALPCPPLPSFTLFYPARFARPSRARRLVAPFVRSSAHAPSLAVTVLLAVHSQSGQSSLSYCIPEASHSALFGF